jgi:hypothetical protein
MQICCQVNGPAPPYNEVRPLDHLPNLSPSGTNLDSRLDLGIKYQQEC